MECKVCGIINTLMRPQQNNSLSLLDLLRYLYATFSGRKRVLLSRRDEWKPGIMRHIDSFYTPFFYDFDKINPDLFDAVIPLRLQDQYCLNANSEYLIYQKNVIPSQAIITLCNDKLRFNQWIKENGLYRYIPKIGDDLDFPYIVKKRVGTWGLDIEIIKNSDDEIRCAEDINSEEYFTQEYICGELEYSGIVFMKENQVIFFKALEFKFDDTYFIKGKKSKFKQVKEVEHSHYQKDFEKILCKLGYQGLCAINYKIVDGSIKVFEINPRYGAYTHRYINELVKYYHID